MINEKHKIVLFDGVCNFCNASVNFIIDHDKKDLYKFASLQSSIGQKYLKNFDFTLDDFDTLILIDGDKFYTSSTAALMVAKDLGGVIGYLYYFIFIPPLFRDIVYKIISKNRYRIFGKNDTCHMPTEDRKNKFIN